MEEVTRSEDGTSPGLSAPVRITQEHDVAQFDCGESALNEWLRRRAVRSESRFSRTYVVCSGARVVAYVCVAAGSVGRHEAPGKIRRNAPHPVPVAIVARLAVDREYVGKGLGSSLLAEALRRIVLASASVGICAVLIHAKSDEARRFYMNCGEFIEHPEGSKRLYMPLDTLADGMA